MLLSILVISRNPDLLNEMLASLSCATKLKETDIEILCSWNGNKKDEELIKNQSGFEFLIAQRKDYHFAKNINSLSELANGDLLLLINDDIILDENSIDSAISCLEIEPKAGIVGARLRSPNGKIHHAGIAFDNRHKPYHLFENLLAADSPEILQRNTSMPAVTGAFLLIRRQDFLKTRFNENYKVCGEDIELCLDLRHQLDLEAYYCPKASGLHKFSSTRKRENQDGDNSEDLSQMKMRRRKFLETISTTQLKIELGVSRRESQLLLSLLHQKEEVSIELNHWKTQSHSLQLERLKQKQIINTLSQNLANHNKKAT